jgi:hypothetical protein
LIYENVNLPLEKWAEDSHGNPFASDIKIIKKETIIMDGKKMIRLLTSANSTTADALSYYYIKNKKGAGFHIYPYCTTRIKEILNILKSFDFN